MLQEQYQHVRSSRSVLFDYCRSLKPEHFVFNHQAFGDRSICYLLVHVANTYCFWLSRFPALNKMAIVREDAYHNIDEVGSLYSNVDLLVNNFLNHYADSIQQAFTARVPGKDIQLQATPLQLFTHVITHEFHHKGQILSMSRQLGYIPVDTDVVRF